MNKEESLKLFKQGRNAWNTWAEERLVERRKLEESGEWIEGSTQVIWNDATWDWHKTARADFSVHKFEAGVSFSGFVFPGETRFNRAIFSSIAQFENVRFEGDAWFCVTNFSGAAVFTKAIFSQRANFMHTIFDGLTSFNNCVFKEGANYHAAQVSRTFFLSGAQFEQTPNFIQTHFAEVPRLDNFHIKPRRFWTGKLDGIRALFKSGAGPAVFWRAGLDSVKALFKGDAELADRWRALKKLAVAAHDHDSELRFFKGEVFAKRRLFFVGLLYSLFSDFGRSVLRPLLLWALGVFGFAWCYFSQAGGRWADVLNWSLPCDAGTGNAVCAALGLSLRNALPLPGGRSAAKLDQIYACLYGIHNNAAGELPVRLRLIIPDGVALAGVAQSLWSVVMIFLLLLALRNHFRMK